MSVIARVLADRDLAFVRLLAQKVVAERRSVALLATPQPQPSLVFAQSAGLPHNMGAMMKDTTAAFGGRGGGSKDFAQGSIADPTKLDDALQHAASLLRS